MKKFLASPLGRVVALVTVLALCLLGAQAASVGASASSSRAAADRPVAQTDAGKLTSRMVGSTGNGRRVTGAFVPLHFANRHGRVFVRGLVQGVVHETNGTRTTFAQLRTVRVSSVNGVPAHVGRAAAVSRASCGVLHLVLGPLHLNLLGLHVDLNRVVLDITAHTGAGNLLGNLLCAVTGLLDGGLGGQLGRLTNLLNRILGVLRLG
jgi:hypothetical protein